MPPNSVVVKLSDPPKSLAGLAVIVLVLVPVLRKPCMRYHLEHDGPNTPDVGSRAQPICPWLPGTEFPSFMSVVVEFLGSHQD